MLRWPEPWKGSVTRVAGQRQEHVEEFVFGPPVWLRRSGGQGRLQGWRGGPAAARSAGWQVGCTPRRAETLRPHTRHRVRLLAESQAAGTSPWRVPARWESMCACKDATDCHPRCRAGSPHKHPSTGQKIRAGRPSSTCMGWECEEPRGRGEWLRRRGRSPPTGVPGEGAMDVSRSGQSRAKPAHQRSQTWVQPGLTMTAAARLPPSTGRSLRAGITSKHLSRVKGKKNSDQLKVPTSTGEAATHTGERLQERCGKPRAARLSHIYCWNCTSKYQYMGLSENRAPPKSHALLYIGNYI